MNLRDEERELGEELARTAIRAYRRGLVAGPGGNVSARIPDRNEVLITSTGISLEMTRVENLVKVDLHAVPLNPGSSLRPSRETGFHCAVYRARPEVNAVVHVHPPHATALSLRNRPLPLVTVVARDVLGLVPCIELAPPGSAELRGYVEEAFSSYPKVQAILMRAHGIIAAGRNLEAAYDTADLVEDSARVAYLSAVVMSDE